MAGRKAATVIDFTWRVHVGGYQWQDAKELTAEGQRRQTLSPANYSLGVSHYKPLQVNTGLFRQFANLSPTKEKILGFANAYGALFEALGWHGRPNQEALLDWQREIGELKTAVELWLLVSVDDRETLSKRIQWVKDKLGESHVVYCPTPGCPPEEQREIASHRLYEHLMELFHEDDPVLPAMHYVRLLANPRIERHVGPTLNYDPSGKDRAKDFRLQLEPKNLCGALWLQFSQAVIGNKEFLECKGCHNWFEVATGGFRKDKSVCSPACRARVYRAGARSANQLRSRGRSVQQIAEAIGVTQRQVRKWLSTFKQKW